MNIATGLPTAALLAFAAGVATAATAQQGAIPFPTGQVIADVVSANDPSQHYALYLPREYSTVRAWPVIFAFDPGARGRVPVEIYRAAAEQYGYVVVGSNNSRNGSQDLSRIVAALTSDVMSRLRIDGKRVYTAGMSGGARVALIVALGSNAVAGVVASSAGYPDSKPRKTLPFPIFSTAGTDDFNHLEMRRLDEALTTPHRLAVFTGGHTWLSPELATQAVEWLEIRAVHDGIAPRDAGRIDALFERRVRAADGAASPKAAYLSAKAIAEDFAGLKDVSAYAARASQLERDRDVRAALKADRDADNREEQTFRTVSGMERQLGSDDDRPGALMQLRRFWKELSEQAKGPADTADRRIARRVLANLAADTGRTADPDYLKIISEYRLPRVRPPDR